MIVRSNRHDRFTVLPNDALRDERLSWKARGLLAYLLSQPDGWRTNSSHLWKQSPNGRDAVRAGLAELLAAGYLVRRKHQNAAGHWITDQIIYDHPVDPSVENPVENGVDKSATGAGSPGVGNSGTLRNTNYKILSEEKKRHSYIGSEAIHSLCNSCNGDGWTVSPTDPNDVERCGCNPKAAAP